MTQKGQSLAQFWVFTEPDYQSLRAALESLDEDEMPEGITYICGQLEVSESGLHHIQGYLECDHRVRIMVEEVLQPHRPLRG